MRPAFSTSSGLQDLVYAGDEHGNLVALNADRPLVWKRNIGSIATTCKMTPDGVWGVTASPVIDRTGNRIYAVGGTDDSYALDLGTGAIAPDGRCRCRPTPNGNRTGVRSVSRAVRSTW